MARSDKGRIEPPIGGLIVLSVFLVGPSLAWAQVPSTSVHATGTVTTGYDTNINGVGEDDPISGGPLRAFTIQPAPGLAFFVDTPRVRLGLTAVNTFLFYVGDPGASDFNTTGQDVAGALAYSLSPTEEIVITANWNRFTTNSVTLQGASETNIRATTGGGDSTLNTFAATESFTKEFTQFLRLVQSGSASFSFDENAAVTQQPPFLTVRGSLGPEAVLGDHALAVLPDAQWLQPTETSDDAAAQGFAQRQQLILTLPGRWRWDFALEWTSELSAGLTTTFTAGEQLTFAPVGTAGVFFTRDSYNAGLSYQRSVTPDVITGQTFTLDAWSAQGSIPIWEPYNLGFQTSTGFALNSVVSETGDPAQDIDTGLVKTWLVDAAVGWRPPQYPSIEVRYQHFQQFGAPAGQQILPNFDRDVVTLVLSYSYPAQNVALPTGQPRRVDGSDRDRTLFGADERQRSQERIERQESNAAGD